MKQLFMKYKEIIIYIIFGVLTTLVRWGATLVYGKTAMPFFVANLLSWITAFLFAYFTNKLWVFESKSWKRDIVVKEFISFFAARAVTGVLEVFCIPALEKIGFDNIFYNLVDKLGITWSIFKSQGIYSTIVFSVIVVILNYFFSKFIVFKKKKEAPTEETPTEE